MLLVHASCCVHLDKNDAALILCVVFVLFEFYDIAWHYLLHTIGEKECA